MRAEVKLLSAIKAAKKDFFFFFVALVNSQPPLIPSYRTAKFGNLLNIEVLLRRAAGENANPLLLGCVHTESGAAFPIITIIHQNNNTHLIRCSVFITEASIQQKTANQTRTKT